MPKTREVWRDIAAVPAFFTMCLGATGCVATTIPTLTKEQAPRMIPHAIFVNNMGRGLQLKCATNSNLPCPKDFKEQLALIADSIRKSPHHQILLRIHGGLNRLSSSFSTTDTMLLRIGADTLSPSGDVYPIFINWESGLRSSYLEHLFFITQGQRYAIPSRVLVSPVYLAADLGRAIARAPFTWGQQARNFFRALRRQNPKPDSAQDDGILRSIGGYPGRKRGTPTRIVIGIIRAPFKAVGVVLVDAFGTPAWENMHRRTKVLFRDPQEFKQVTKQKRESCANTDRIACETESFSRPTGAVSLFLDTLQAISQADSRFRITLIGHSMGAIVGDEIIRTRDSLPFDNIVFMAAASSARDVEMAVVPYMERHPHTNFFDLTLHPTADLNERTFHGFGPGGSLLEWIDAYLANPETDLDRVVGKYANVREAEHTFPPSVRNRIHIKAFGYLDGLGCGPESEPYHHGGFNDASVPFWRKELWQPGTSPCPTFDPQRHTWVERQKR